MRPRLHGASIVGRARADRGLLLMMGLVVAFATVITSAVAPLTERTSDRAVAGAVRDAGPRGAVVATSTDQGDDGQRTRDPLLAASVRADAEYAQEKMPELLAAVVRPSTTSVTTPALHLLDAGPGRYLRLAYVDRPGPPAGMTYVSGGPPRPGVPASRADEEVIVRDDVWPVQVALSQSVATALDLQAGDRLQAEDEQNRPVVIVVSGVFTADDPRDGVWAAVAGLLLPTVGRSDGLTRTTAAAIVSADSLPDLRLAVPADDLTSRVVFTPEPSKVRWAESGQLTTAVASLQASAGRSSGGRSWDSLLDRVLADSRAEVSAARGQASALVLGLLAGTGLLLVQGADLLARRRSSSVGLVRDRGASLVGLFMELFVESAAVALLGSLTGLLLALTLVGDVGWQWSLPVVAVAAAAGPTLSVVTAARRSDVRRVPANRSARRLAARVRHGRRLLVEGLVVAVAVVSFVALHQRGVVDGTDLVGSSAPMWWAAAGGLVIARLLPLTLRLVLARARRSTGAVRLIAAARTSRTVRRILPSLVVVVIVSQLTAGIALAATERDGQADGALLSVGGDARLQTAPDGSLASLATRVAGEPGVTVAVAARVEDGVRASSDAGASAVRLVIVDAAAFQKLLVQDGLPDAPQLSRLRTVGGVGLRALVRGGGADLRDGLRVRWEDTLVSLDVVGIAPRVGDVTDPVVILDAEAFAATGAAADPDTVWAFGRKAAAVLRDAAGPAGTVDVLTDELDDRRSAPLPAGLVHLAMASSLLLFLFAVLSVVLAAAAETPLRLQALGRLRSLGLNRAETRRMLLSELLGPVLVAAVGGLVIGIGAALTMFGPLSLELVTGQTAAPDLVVPWWTVLPVVALGLITSMIARAEATRIGRTPLSGLLRGGDRD